MTTRSMTLGVIGLGLVASGKRNIQSGYEFDKLYDRSSLLGTNPIIGSDHSDTYDTLNRMSEIVLDTLTDTEKVAAKLKGNTLEETLRNDWNHVYRHFQYEKDATGIEQIRRPSRSWEDRRRGIDCDCMSVVLSSLLYHQKIPHAFRKATYNEETGWQHVYVIVPKKGVSLNDFIGSKNVARNKYYTLDCVVDKFDHEVPTLKKFDKVMKIQYLNGLDESTLNGGVTAQTASMANIIPFSTEELLGLFGNEFNILEGLDGTNERQVLGTFLLGLKQHLVNTRSILTINPALTVGLYNPTQFAQRLDALIEAFDDSELRSKVLGELAALEQREEINGLGNVGLGKGFFKKIGQGIKKVGRGIANVAKKVAKAVVRFNPATIAIRNGLLLAMKLNVFRLAEKLGYGYWTEEQAKAKGLDIDQFRKNKKALEKVRNIHKSIGGKIEKLDNAIKQGWKKGVKKHNLVGGLGYTSNNLYTKARIGAAMPLLQMVQEHLKDVPFSTVTRKNDNNELNEFFQAVRTNRNGIATKLGLAYKPSGEANGYHKGEYKKLLDRVRTVEQMVVAKGGTPDQLRNAVQSGKLVAIKKDTLGVLPAAIAPAGATLAKIASLLKSVDYKSLLKGALKNKAAQIVKGKKATASSNSNNGKVAQPAATPSAPSIESDKEIVDDLVSDFENKNPRAAKAINKVKKAVKQFRESPSNSQNADDVQDTEAEVVETKINRKDSSDAQVVTTDTSNKVEKNDNMVKYIAIGAAALTGIALLGAAFKGKPTEQTALPPSPSPPQPMSGVKAKHRSSQRTHIAAKPRKKVMAITM
ncbi:MAG: hypothetical protein JSS93_04190 [Bacteroidetes bacterium]|nr:hypothetical protein [Bacteroidota bacterium]MBS1981701.1 hypothetical protein [Bacteroidota bacterium]